MAAFCLELGPGFPNGLHEASPVALRPALAELALQPFLWASGSRCVEKGMAEGGELWVTGAQNPKIDHFLSYQASGGRGKCFA